MSTVYYKATRPDGTSVQSGIDGKRVDYGAALVSGEVVRHPEPKKVRDDPHTYLSISVAAADCTGAQWPCRLFRVEPVGRVMANLSASPNKRAVSALRVVEELPAHLSLGPNGEQVAAFIEGCQKLTATDWKRVASARYAARDAARYAAWDAARDAAGVAARDAAWYAAGDAAGAIITRDIITAEQYAILTQAFVDAGFAALVGRA